APAANSRWAILGALRRLLVEKGQLLQPAGLLQQPLQQLLCADRLRIALQRRAKHAFSPVLLRQRSGQKLTETHQRRATARTTAKIQRPFNPLHFGARIASPHRKRSALLGGGQFAKQLEAALKRHLRGVEIELEVAEKLCAPALIKSSLLSPADP